MSHALRRAREERDLARRETEYQTREAQRLSGLLFAALDELEEVKHGQGI